MVRLSLRTVINNVVFMSIGAVLCNVFTWRQTLHTPTPSVHTQPDDDSAAAAATRRHCDGCEGYDETWNYTWDGGPEHFTGHHTEVRWRSLYFIRHGNYHSNGEHAGHLTAIGEKQAQLVAARLVALELNFSRWETSTSPRAVETAQIIETKLRGGKSPQTKFQPNPDLREGWPAMPQPTASYPKRTEESIEWEKSRMARAFMAVFKRPAKGHYPDSSELYVCHGNIISYFVLRSLQVSIQRFLRLTIQQASITVIDVNSKGLFKVRIIGDVGHLPHSLWTHQ